jgi:diguanylate cyclase (GGDEF)-like protein/PAS domain S-box-containing protein
VVSESPLVQGGQRSVRAQRDALLRLASIAQPDFDVHVLEILRVNAQIMGVARVGYWSFENEKHRLTCERLFIDGKERSDTGMSIDSRECPTYFESLHQGQTLLIRDTKSDPRSMELYPSYTSKLGIGAMLDVPVYVRGVLSGIVCHEHVGGARDWTDEEAQFAFSIGQHLALASEARTLRRITQELKESEARFRTLIESTPTPTWVVSAPEGVCLFGNRAASIISGVPVHEMVGRRGSDFYEDPSDRERVQQQLSEQGNIRDMVLRFKRVTGEGYWGSISMERIVFDGANALIISLTDVTVHKSQEEHLRHLALYDAVTKLPNRTLLSHSIERELGRRERSPKMLFGLCFLDLDGFKDVNDAHGHATGDALLAEVGARLVQTTRKQDLPARVGGDEFAVLFPDVNGREQVMALGVRMLDVLCRPYRLDGKDLRVTASLGFVLSDDKHTTAQGLLAAADEAMYCAKKSKNRISFA